jgi:hypothetical protein
VLVVHGGVVVVVHGGSDGRQRKAAGRRVRTLQG